MMMTKTKIDDAGLEDLVKNGPNWLAESRKAAWQNFQALPFPTLRDEAWRRTDPERVNPAEHITYAPKSTYEMMGGEGLPAGVSFGSLESVLDQVQDRLGKLVPKEGKKFSSLNSALWSGGTYVRVSKDASTGEGALHAHHTFTTGDKAAGLTRSLIIGERFSKSTIMETFTSDDESLMAAPAVEIELEEGANMRYVFVHQFGKSTSTVPTIHAKVAKDAHLQVLFVGFGGRMAKLFVESDLAGEGCKSEVLGIVMGQNRQHFDIDVVQNHDVGANVSDVLCHIALTDRARSVFSGNVICDPGAQKIDGYQQNRNLLLSDKARADSMPKLEIEANDVRCTHGATFTTYDANQRFYLESRGLDKFEAESMLVKGFFQEVINRLQNELVVEHLKGLLETKMSGALKRPDSK